MDKLKPNRKFTSSPQNVEKMTMIIAMNWGETWQIVCDRAKVTQSRNRQSLIHFSRIYRDSKL